MNRRDRGIVGVLVLVLILLGVVLAIPRAPVDPAAVEATPDLSLPPIATYREGVVGVAESVTPVTARNRAERTLVGLVFSGLVRLGPGSTYQPDLAESWTTSDDGKTWTFRIRDDAVWHDGEPVTAEDVVFTIDALKSPDAAGAAAASWADVTATAVDDQTVTFTLGTPIAGFLAAATQPLLPAHLLDGVTFAELAGSDFARLPVGTGPYAISELDGERAVLVPAMTVLPGSEEPADGGSPSPTADSLATPMPPPVGAVASPYLDRIELRFFDDEAGVAAALKAGDIDAAAGLSTATTSALAALPGAERFRYPTTTLSTVLLNLRPGHPELRDAKVRRALLAAIDRDALAADVLGGDAVRADGLVPPGSWAFDSASVGTVPFDRKAALKLLDNAGWTRKDGKLYAPKGKEQYSIELLTVPAEANARIAAAAAHVRDAWSALGIKVDLREVPVPELGTRLREGDFAAAALDIAQGLEPDLYPLLASSQVRGAGSNLAGFQDPALDKLLEAARAAGTTEQRQAAWKALLAGVAERQPLLPLAWGDDVMVATGLDGPAPRLIAHPGDRFWDVLAWRLAADR